jgi:uncharacterized protein (DUF3820 family)
MTAKTIELDDDSLMPWGKHKGERMEDVPDKYLKWIYWKQTIDAPVKKYVEEYLQYFETDEN